MLIVYAVLTVRSCERYNTGGPLSFGSHLALLLLCSVQRIMYTIGNFYVIAAVAVIGGGLFGFDISSMSAIIGMQLHGYNDQSKPLTDPRRHASIQMLLQRRRQHQRRARMPGTKHRRHGWHHRCNDSRLLGWCSGIWISLRHARQAAIDHDRLRALDYRFNHHLRSSEHPNVGCRTHHQRFLCRYPVCTGSCLHQRVCAAY